MAFSLSEDQKRRIEQEEKVRVAEEAYRNEVRNRIASGEPEPSQRSPVRKFLIALVVVFVAYLVLKGH